jgi:hypothetical protein
MLGILLFRRNLITANPGLTLTELVGLPSSDDAHHRRARGYFGGPGA